jgi:hypothetical protein
MALLCASDRRRDIFFRNVSLLVERVVSFYFLDDNPRHVVACRCRSQPVELLEFGDAGEYGTLEHEPLLAFSRDTLLPIEVMFFAISLQCTLGDRAILGFKNCSSFFNRNVVVACRVMSGLVASGRDTCSDDCWLLFTYLFYRNTAYPCQPSRCGWGRGTTAEQPLQPRTLYVRALALVGVPVDQATVIRDGRSALSWKAITILRFPAFASRRIHDPARRVSRRPSCYRVARTRP